MRTTLKRGIGRGTAANGNGRAAVPPVVSSPMTRYSQSSRPRSRLRLVGRIVFWLMAILLMLAASLAGGAYLFFDQSISAIRAKTPALKLAQARLDVAPPNKPATALIVGYDARAGEGGLPSRSDTLMLLRADPEVDAISMMSFPRDLSVPIMCEPGAARFTGRINAAYAECGVKGSLETVKNLTNLQINYLITVNFRAFTQVVSKLGGVWVDVDRRYFNDNEGVSQGFTYATIDLQPGYQLLNGSDALDFVRFRHTDNDLYRNARQQLFVRALKDRLTHDFSPADLPRMISIIERNVEVGVGGGGELPPRTVLRYAAFAYSLPAGRFFQTRIGGLYGTNELYTPTSNIQAAVQEFLTPDVESADKAAAAAGIRRKARKKSGPRPSQVTVTVLNGNDVEGAAANARSLLAERGYQTLLPPANREANAPRQDYFHTKIYYDPGQRRSRAAARGLQTLIGSADLVRGIPPGQLSLLANGAMTLVVVGQTFHGSIAPAPADRTPKPAPAAVTFNRGETLRELRSIRRRVRFTLQVPNVLEKASSLERPIRVYRLPDGHKGVRLTFKTSRDVAGYWGIQQTDWDDAPVLSGKSFRHFHKGRIYDYYFTGPRLHMVVLREQGATFWVVNTLLDTLSNETMIAIARGLRPLPARVAKPAKARKRK
ncbi:MAG: LCP family protein [Actinobacteria bacterium]|nr:LCP family protein [Actinomycetota bacterium]